ncbi:putative holin-like toxin [Eubacterium aggregans]|uniref:putative holin-like toxin n=1 Tax=Eubacterium aggregans TaxID=81409 RepID=UPI003F30BA6B
MIQAVFNSILVNVFSFCFVPVIIPPRVVRLVAGFCLNRGMIGGGTMTVYEGLMLMLTFGGLVVLLLSFHNDDK